MDVGIPLHPRQVAGTGPLGRHRRALAGVTAGRPVEDELQVRARHGERTVLGGRPGSAVWVEQFKRDLARDAVAYANLDGAGGTNFGAAGVPQIDDALIEATKPVTDPRTGEA